MKSNKAAIVIIGVIAVGVIAFFVYRFFNSEKEYNKYEWFEDYAYDDEQPYDIDIFKSLMEDYFPGQDFYLVKDQFSKLDLENEEGAIFLSLGKGIYLSESDAEALMDFVQDGNTAMLLVQDLPMDIYQRLFPYEVVGVLEYEWQPRIQTNFYHSDLKVASSYSYAYRYYEKEIAYPWAYYPKDLFVHAYSRPEKLGFFGDDKVNFLRMEYGDGMIYIHSTPVAFTNYFMCEKELIRYVEGVMAHLPEGDIYFDQFHHRPYLEIDPYESSGPSVGPLDYILSQQSLAWAFYLILSLSLIYILFQAKRKQRIIPIAEEKSNTSLEFIETIGLLYFQQRRHQKLMSMQWKLWLAHIRDRYRLDTRQLDDLFVKRLHQKSQVSEEEIPAIIEFYNEHGKEDRLSTDDLAKFYHLLEAFYQNQR